MFTSIWKVGLFTNELHNIKYAFYCTLLVKVVFEKSCIQCSYTALSCSQAFENVCIRSMRSKNFFFSGMGAENRQKRQAEGEAAGAA